MKPAKEKAGDWTTLSDARKRARLEDSLLAIRENCINWPATMTRERIIKDLGDALDGWILETLS